MEQFDLDAFLPYQLAVAATRVSRAFAERYRAEFGLSIPEWRVLAHLSRSGAVSVREIEAMALVLAAMGLPAIPPGAALPGDHPASLLEGTADV